MKTLITPLQVLRLAFGGGDYLPPDSVTEADITGAEQRHIVPVVGRALYEKLLEGSYAGFRDEYLAAPTALFTRLALQSRLDISTGQCGTTAPKTACGQPAGEHLFAHRDEFPEYDPENDTLRRCTTDGGFVQIH